MIMILANKKYNLRRSEELNIRLTKLGLPSACIIYFDGVSITELLLKSMLLTQLFIVKKAQEKGMVDCFFLRDRGLLKLSSDFIYHRWDALILFRFLNILLSVCAIKKHWKLLLQNDNFHKSFGLGSWCEFVCCATAFYINLFNSFSWFTT